MSRLVYIILSTSLAGSFAALIPLFAGRLLGSRAGQRFVYYLWLAVLLRFLLPLPGALDPLAADMVMPDTPTEYTHSALPTPAEPGAAGDMVDITINALPRHDIPALIWAGGAAASLLWQITAYLRLRKRLLTDSTPSEDCRAHRKGYPG